MATIHSRDAGPAPEFMNPGASPAFETSTLVKQKLHKPCCHLSFFGTSSGSWFLGVGNHKSRPIGTPHVLVRVQTQKLSGMQTCLVRLHEAGRFGHPVQTPSGLLAAMRACSTALARLESDRCGGRLKRGPAIINLLCTSRLWPVSGVEAPAVWPHLVQWSAMFRLAPPPPFDRRKASETEENVGSITCYRERVLRTRESTGIVEADSFVPCAADEMDKWVGFAYFVRLVIFVQ